MADEKVTIVDVQVDFQKSIEAIAKCRENIEQLRQRLQALKEMRGELGEEEYQQQVAMTTEAIKAQNAEINTWSRQTQNQVKANQEAEGSLSQLRAQLSIATKEYDSMSKAERESAQGEALRNHINGITTELKSAEEETQRYYRNVGNYKNAINDVLGVNSKWFQSLQTLSTALSGGVTQALSTAGSAVASFGRQLLALLANPIVAVIAGIVVVVMALAKAIKSDEDATNSLQRILAPFKGLLDLVTSALQALVGFILKAVEGFEKMAMGLSKLMEKLPVVGGMFKTVNTAIENQTQATIANQKAVEMERQLTVQSAKTQNEIAKLRNKVAQSDKYTAKERRAMLIQAINLEKQEAQAQIALAKQKLKALQLEAQNTKNTAEMKMKLAQAEAEVIKQDTAYYELTRRMQAQLAQFDKELKGGGSSGGGSGKIKTGGSGKSSADIAKERAELEANAVKEAEDAMLVYIKNNYDQRIAQTQLQYDREIQALQLKLRTEKNLTVTAKQALNDEIEAKQYALGEALADIYEEQAQEQEKLQADAEKKQKEAQEKIDADMLASKKKDWEIDVKELQNHLAEALLNEKKTNAEILKLQEQEAKDELELLQQRGRLSTQTQADYDAEVLNARKKLKDATKKVNDEEIKNEQEKNKALTDMGKALTSLTETIGESNKAFAQMSKVLALAQVAISSGEAIAKGVSQAQSVPFPANIGAIATTITAILTGITQAYSAINSAKFATGGYVSGAGTGTSDSIPARLSNGEYVVNARSTAMYRPMLEAMNNIGVGALPQVMGSYDSIAQADTLTESFKQGAQEIKPVVSVVDINKGQKRVALIEKLDTI